jgi:hypothetical protein
MFEHLTLNNLNFRNTFKIIGIRELGLLTRLYDNGEARIPGQSYTLLGRTLLYYTWSLQHLVTYSTPFAFVPTDKQYSTFII